MIDDADVPVVSLSEAPGERAAWGRPARVVFAWAGVELLLVRNPWQISSRLRVWALRKFGASIGRGVIFRPDTRVKFPWNLTVGDNCWIGEGVWFHNQDKVILGHDVVISQQTMLTTGSHKHATNMALTTRPITVHDGAWITSRCLITGGVTIGRSALVAPMTVVNDDIPPNTKVSGQEIRVLGKRFQ
ncbi:acetyltransferase [Curtobacterium sp. VKM Ac-1376]|uniref:acetyltransferase n=1 Tax=Curtobacterium sp. VKM Ac-1376 TaxID=123312 RepID=UPI0019E681D8|nr:acetyltransferase [Curtobacterium sp. VKM Ac-1376]MBF4614151.1 acetyltransferase [Curtobacterium sp. VKM Ac-1376]